MPRPQHSDPGVPCAACTRSASDNLGILEWDSVTNTLVEFFPNQTGYLSAAPADDKILVLNYDYPTVDVLQPLGASRASGQDPSPKSSQGQCRVRSMRAVQRLAELRAATCARMCSALSASLP